MCESERERVRERERERQRQRERERESRREGRRLRRIESNIQRGKAGEKGENRLVETKDEGRKERDRRGKEWTKS